MPVSAPLLRRLGVLVLLVVLPGLAPAAAQTRAETERRLHSLRGQIDGVEQQVQRVRGEEASAVEALDALSTEITLREQLLAGYRQQVGTIRTETGALQGSIGRLEGEIDLAKETYRQRARHAYMYGRRNALALILSAGSVNQMIVRARYLQQFARRRRTQVERIGEQTAELRTREGAIRESLEATQRLLQQSEAERETLGLRRRERSALVEQTRSRRSDLEQQLAQRRADASSLERLVQSLTTQERRRTQAAREQTARAETERVAAAQAAAATQARAETERQAGLQREADAAARRAAERRDLRLRPTPRRETTPDVSVPTAPPVAQNRPSPSTRRTRPAPAPTPAPTPAARVPAAEPIAEARPDRPTRRTRPTPAPAPRPAPAAAPRPEPAAAPRPEPAAAPRPEPAADAPSDVSGSFAQNRGRLPWPADGTVTGAFGTRTDPDYGTSIQSIGVDLSTRPGAPSRAVFEGTVERVGTMATYGTFVMVSHGDFTTIYGNLSEVVVSRGQTVRAGQVVGRAGTATARRGSQLFFALFQNGRPVNPVPWLRGR